MHHRWLAAVALAIVIALPAAAKTLPFHAVLTPATEVPPPQSTGTGTADVTLDTDTHKLTYDVTFKDFASSPTMAHFHGPAAAGANAGVQVSLGNSPKSPIHGVVTLTTEQERQLLAGQWYANVHTAMYPKGEIRGQMMPTK